MRSIEGPASAETTGRSESEPDRWIGRIVDGRYRVLDIAGRGGMGAVYRVEHLRMGKIAAMKVMHGALAADRELAARFRREAEAVSRLAQVHTVQVFDFGEHEHAMYLIMELVRGESLGKLLRREGALSFARAGNIAAQVCESLAEAHEQGIIHRDIKPENLLVTRTRDGQDFVKVLDFGLALVRDARELEITQRGSLVGTPYFMSPEQIKGEALDARSDVYSLGAVLYRCLTGENPFVAPTPLGVLTKHMTEEPSPPRLKRPELPHEADEIVLRAMQKRREQRYESAEAMRSDLLRVLPVGGSAVVRVVATEDFGSPGVSLSREDVEAFERSVRRQRTLRFFVTVLGVVGLIGAMGWFALRSSSAELRDNEAEPNNEPAEATVLGSGHAVAGYIGKRHSREESDRDWYRFRVGGTGIHVLRAEVTAVPNMDLKLEVYASDRTKIAGADATGMGHPEALMNVGLLDGTYFLLVREVWTTGKPPTENLSDSYTLLASVRPASSSDEVEPNDEERSAQTVRGDSVVMGFLDRADDVDFFRVEAATGATVSAEITPPPGVDVALQVVRPRPIAGDSGLTDRAGAGGPEQCSGIVAADEALILAVRRKGPISDDPSRPPALAQDLAYRLALHIEK